MTDLPELLAFARSVSSALPDPPAQPQQWMRLAGDLADECRQGVDIRPALAAVIPVAGRGTFRRAVDTLGSCSTSFGGSKVQPAREALQTIIAALEKAYAEDTGDRETWLKNRPGQLDPMGVANRQSFDEDLVLALREATTSSPLAFLISDADDFKKVNDQFGHPVGDVVLHRLASHHEYVARARGKAYRIGGEEFVILLPNTTEAEAIATASRLRKQIAETQIEEIRRPMTVSVGVATASDGSVDIYALADDALLRAKKDGKDRVISASGKKPRPAVPSQTTAAQAPPPDPLVGRPPDVPPAVFKTIQDKAEHDWPDNFSMRLFATRTEIEAYRKLYRPEPSRTGASDEPNTD
jgi:diguanylate cyclase (GGDEF)-like protein